jgi:outer membrane protein
VRKVLFSCACAVLGCGALRAQQSLTIAESVESALRTFPSIRVSQEQTNAAAAGIQLARTAYLPRIDATAQVNRATRNNVFGLLLPQNVLPSLSGPVIGSNNFGTAWGSAAGVLVSWEPFDFGLRRASVAAATSARLESEAALRRTQFEVAVATADAFLTVAAAQETVKAAQAGVDRAEAIARTIKALVDATLRPGADASRADAEVAAARTQLIQAQQATEIARANLARFVGTEPNAFRIVATKLSELPPEQRASPAVLVSNPIAAEQDAAVEQAKAQLRALERTYFPRFYVQASASARGTGAETNGGLLGGVNGLAPDTQNYALGFTVTFSPLDHFAIHAKESAQTATIRAQAARARQIATELRAQWNAAVARLDGARKIAANTPVQITAARDASQQATARYQSGLGNIDAVAEAHRLLAQAEIDDALARLSVWRGLLEIASVAGDLQPFLNEVSQEPGR